jgi:hypothetical protein
LPRYDVVNYDGNLRINTELKEENIAFYSSRHKPFKIFGLYNSKDGQAFRRVPQNVAESTSESVKNLNLNTAGGRVRFSTDSEFIALKVLMSSLCHMPNMPLSGSSGFDMYVGDEFCKAFIPPIKIKDGYEEIYHFGSKRMRDIEINFPLYNPVDDLFIGLETFSAVGDAPQYKYKKHVVYYGSSITQGGCASRPGNSYQAIISRKLGCNYINFGFSGSAKGEDAIINYIADLDMSVFVCDYDHNSPNIEHLKNTHDKIYKKMRGRNPGLPVIFVSRPDFDKNIDDASMRREVIYETYLNALNSGDKNVFYIDGKSLFMGEYRDCCTVDGTHPNDSGFVRMADIIGKEIERCLKGVQRL